MLFNSNIFLFLFFPAVLFIYFKLIKNGKGSFSVSWLIFSSLFFYSWWNPPYLFLLVFSIGLNYFLGRLLITRGNKRGRGLLLYLGVGINLGLICYFKYFNFFIDSINILTATKITIQPIVLPLGISFFTFQQIAYLVDAYRGEIRNPSVQVYCCFICFFPQLIAGPIVQHKEMIPQIEGKNFDRQIGLDMAVGMTIFAIGLFKKVIIADSLAQSVTPIFSKAELGVPLDFFSAWKGAVSYSFQLYFDFSGYSDMAIGLGRMFGYRLPINFNSPYRAVDVIDFWKRWHITLSRFLKKYLYIPLGGNRKGTFRRYLNLMITMLLGGLWHGAGWTFVFWGGLHGIFLIINHGWRRIWPTKLNCWWYIATARMLTFLSVTIAWVFFRAESFNGARIILKSMINLPHTLKEFLSPISGYMTLVGFQFDGPGMALANYFDLALFITWMILLWFWPNTQEWMSSYEPVLKNRAESNQLTSTTGMEKMFFWHPRPAWGIVVGMMTVLSIMHLSKPSEFLYFQF